MVLPAPCRDVNIIQTLPHTTRIDADLALATKASAEELVLGVALRCFMLCIAHPAHCQVATAILRYGLF